MRSIAIINQKGGVGKTTTAVNLSAALALAGKRVCMVDLDPQAHTTLHLGCELEGDRPSLYDLLAGEVELADVLAHIDGLRADGELWVVGSHIDLAAIEVELAGETGREQLLRKKLAPVDGQFDYLIVDCPPSLGLLTLNALVLVDEVFLPMQAHFLALHGLSKLLETVDLVASRANRRLRVTGVLFCMYDAGTRLSTEVTQDVTKYFRRSTARTCAWDRVKIFRTRIRRNIRLAEAPSFGQSIFEYAPDSHGAMDYRELSREVLRLHARTSLFERQAS